MVAGGALGGGPGREAVVGEGQGGAKSGYFCEGVPCEQLQPVHCSSWRLGAGAGVLDSTGGTRCCGVGEFGLGWIVDVTASRVGVCCACHAGINLKIEE